MDNFKKIWNNPRYNALIKLGVYFVFFALIVIFCNTPSQESNTKVEETPKEEVQSFKDLEIMKNDLLINTYKYSFKINRIIDKSLIVFNGELSDEVDSGYYESKTEIFKYKCTLEKCYKVFSDHEEEFIMDEFPLMYIMSTFKLIETTSPNINELDDAKLYNYLVDVQGENWEIIIKTSYDEILEINLKTQKETYELKFIK